MATSKRSTLDISGLVVEDVTSMEARKAGHSMTDEDVNQERLDFEEKVAIYVREHQVPKAIAVIMAQTGYSKGTANRIYADEQKRQRSAREAAHAAQQAKSAKQPSQSVA